MKAPTTGLIRPLLILAFTATLMTACSEEESLPDAFAGLKKIATGAAADAGVRAELFATEDLFAGYNRITVALFDNSGNPLSDFYVTLYPEMDMGTMKHSCPLENPVASQTPGLYEGSVLFTMPSGEMGKWTLALALRNTGNNETANILFDITVKATTPSRVVSLKTTDDVRYHLSYYFPESMRVGVNPFIVVAYTVSEDEFVPAEDLSITLAPEMPSMDHGSPNNVDPVHITGSYYQGKVNFTMTGEWRLNLNILEGDAVIASPYFDVVVL